MAKIHRKVQDGHVLVGVSNVGIAFRNALQAFLWGQETFL